MQKGKKTRKGASGSSRRKSSQKGKTNRHGQKHHQRASDQSRRRRPHRRSGGAKNNRKNGIDPARFINEVVVRKEEEKYVPKHRFADFGFNETILENLNDRGYRTPTPIQDQTITPILEGRDLIGLANTGTGKTAAFVLPMVERLSAASEPERVLILAPTRELAGQIDEELKAFAAGQPVTSALLIGGVPIWKQRNALRSWPQVLIATPGRLLDLIGQKELSLSDVSVFILDEMDRMLDMGFIRDIEKIIGHLPDQKQTLCFSATITKDIEKLLTDLLHDPVQVSVVRRETAEHIRQDVIPADSKEEKIAVLKRILKAEDATRVLVFGRTKWGVQKLARQLEREGIPSEAIHGNKTQPQRERALEAFKKGEVLALVATDVAARGLDIDDVSHVINFDQPATYDDYVHRIGRTGRAGKQGHALTFVPRSEARNLNS